MVSISLSSKFSFNDFILFCSVATVMYSPPFSAKTWNASLISVSVSTDRCLDAIIFKNSGNSMLPFSSASTSLIILVMSSSQGLCPNAVSTSASSDFYLHVGEKNKFGSVEEEKKWAIRRRGKKRCGGQCIGCMVVGPLVSLLPQHGSIINKVSRCFGK